METAEGTPERTLGTATTAARARSYRWVDLWHWPIRVMHWVAALSIVVLFITGLYIGRPYFMTGGEASSHFLMGRMRFAHLLGAAILVATGIVRAYFLLAGNRYERFGALFPVRPRDWRNLWKQIKAYSLIDPEGAPHFLGHNPLQQFSYTMLYVVTIVMAVTGFALYGQSHPDGVIYALFGWVNPLLGGAQVTRFWHHALMWVFAIFIPVHLYFAVRADVTEKEGSISSMINGGKFVREDLTYEDE